MTGPIAIKMTCYGAVLLLCLDPVAGRTAVTPFSPPGQVRAPDLSRLSPADEHRCLTAAIYYESALEPQNGQEAVAQVILNRARQPQYPRSICGVVWQGHERSTGCQFSFTCDGSLRRKPAPALWEKAAAVAEQMLASDSRTGPAFDPAPLLNYHAVYVRPAWRLGLVERGRIGNHIFYARSGRATLPPAPARMTGTTHPAPQAALSVWGIKLSDAVRSGTTKNNLRFDRDPAAGDVIAD